MSSMHKIGKAMDGRILKKLFYKALEIKCFF